MIAALVNGTLAQDPVERSTSKGNRFVTVSLRVPVGGESVFIGCAAFDTQAAERLGGLRKGAAVAIAGELQLNVWEDRQGAERRDWRILANEVMSVNQARRRRQRNDGQVTRSDSGDGGSWVPSGAEYLDA